MEEAPSGDDRADIFVWVDDQQGSVMVAVLVVGEVWAQGIEGD